MAKPRSAFPVHLFLLAAFPPVAVFCHNLGNAQWWELFAAIVGMELIAIALLVCTARICGCFRRAAIASSICVLLVAGFGFMYQLNPMLEGIVAGFRLPWIALFLIWLLNFAGVIFWMSKKRSDEPTITKFANTFAVIAFGAPIAVSLGSICTGSSSPPRLIMTEPIPELNLTLSPSKPRRDIYYLVFDRYAGDETLRDDFEFDNEPFLEALRKRGFVVAQRANANYPKTDLSMASALNMQYHGETLESKAHYYQMLKHHRVGRLLKSQGYSYYHLGTLLDGLRTNPHADENLWISPMPSEYTDILYQYSVFQPLCNGVDSRDETLAKFDRVAQLAKESGKPKFVYAHFLAPHYPWNFNPDGSKPSAEQLAQRSKRESYIKQLEHTNQRIIDMLDVILAAKGPAPIIIIGADEGPELMYEGDAEKSRDAQIRKRSGVVSAFHLPGCQPDVVPADISPVNTFRLIFREYFDADMELLPDRSYYWVKHEPLGRPHFGEQCLFEDVTFSTRQGSRHQSSAAAAE